MTAVGRLGLVPQHEAQETVHLDGESVRSLPDAMRALPDPDTLTPGTLLLMPAMPPSAAKASLASRLFRALSGPKVVPSALRCSALVARGYVGVGATASETARDDVAWGWVPPRA